MINKAKEKWVLAKRRRKFPKKVVSVLVRDQGVQANLFEDLDSEEPDSVGEQTGETILEERQSRRRRSAAVNGSRKCIWASKGLRVDLDSDDS